MSDTKSIQLQRGDKGCMQVVSIMENVKNFPTSQGHRYRHDITFVNDKTELIKCEYLTPDPVQDVFRVGKKACFEAINHGVIIPVGDPEEWEIIGDNILLPKTTGGEIFIIALQEAIKVAVVHMQVGNTIEPTDIFANADLFYDWLLSKHKRTLNIMK